jgi:nucleoside-diphosphate-sugar epimerase
MATGSDQTLTMHTVLLLGASSQIGVFAIPQLLLAGFRVLAVSRKGKPEGFPDFESVDWLNETEALQAAESCQYLLSAGPLELAKKFLTVGGNKVNPDITPATPGTTPVTPDLVQGPFQTAVIFSSSSVKSKQMSGNLAERSQIQDMLSLESDIQRMAKSSGLKLVIFRPTLIYGCGLDANISRLANWIDRYGFMPVNGKAAGLRQPVHANDLASVAITAMRSKETLPDVMFLTGGDTVSYSDMVRRIFTAMEKPAKLIRLPEWLFVQLARFAGVSKIGKGINMEMVKRQRLDLVFDDREARELLNYNPRPFAPSKEDFSLPGY